MIPGAPQNFDIGIYGETPAAHPPLTSTPPLYSECQRYCENLGIKIKMLLCPARGVDLFSDDKYELS
jgi:hypothetical protein